MSTPAEQLKERVRLLQKELELKRRLLKKAEKIKLFHSNSKNPSNDFVNTEQTSSITQNKDACYSESATDSHLNGIFLCSKQSSLVADLRSCVLCSSVSVPHNGVICFRLLGLLSPDHQLKLYLMFPDVDRFQLVWSKRLNANQVDMIRLIGPYSSEGINSLCGILLLERFEFSQVCTLVFTLFVFKCSLMDSTIHLIDTLVVPYSIVQSQQYNAKGATICDTHSATDFITWLFVYVPHCTRYFVLEISSLTEDSSTLTLVNSIDATTLSVDLSPSWNSVLRFFPHEERLHSFVAVHSPPLCSTEFLGHWCNRDCSESEFVCIPFLIQLPDPLGRDTKLVASNIMPLRLASHPSRVLLSVVLSVSDTGVPSHVLLALLHCSNEVTCVVLRFCKIVPIVEEPFDSFTCICSLPPSDQYLQLLYIVTTVLAGRSYVSVFGWSLAHILMSSDAVPLQLSIQIPMDVAVFFLPLRKLELLNIFSELSKLVFVHDTQSKTHRILCRF